MYALRYKLIHGLFNFTKECYFSSYPLFPHRVKYITEFLNNSFFILYLKREGWKSIIEMVMHTSFSLKINFQDHASSYFLCAIIIPLFTLKIIFYNKKFALTAFLINFSRAFFIMQMNLICKMSNSLTKISIEYIFKNYFHKKNTYIEND